MRRGYRVQWLGALVIESRIVNGATEIRVMTAAGWQWMPIVVKRLDLHGL